MRVGVAIVTVAVLALVVTPARAWLDTRGSGSAEALEGPRGAALVTTVAASGLYPSGLTARVATVSITNTGGGPVLVTSISQGSSLAVGGCTAGSVRSVGLSRPLGLVPISGSSVLEAGESRSYRVSVSMGIDAPAGCIGQAFTLPVTVGTAAA